MYTRLINVKTINSPLGQLIACANEYGICMLEFSDKKSLIKEQNEILEYFDAQFGDDNNPYFELLEQQLSEYFSGLRTEFTIPLFFIGTDFQKNVWSTLIKIPFGRTVSYQDQANEMSNPKAVRAVANANGKNKIVILVPCHRVIGSNGKLTGYSCGIWRKQKLLELEKSI